MRSPDRIVHYFRFQGFKDAKSRELQTQHAARYQPEWPRDFYMAQRGLPGLWYLYVLNPVVWLRWKCSDSSCTKTAWTPQPRCNSSDDQLGASRHFYYRVWLPDCNTIYFKRRAFGEIYLCLGGIHQRHRGDNVHFYINWNGCHVIFWCEAGEHKHS